MNSLMEEQKKQKRERSNKRWSGGEIRCILNYMENSTNVELPTAQVYYRKLITETGINASWDLVKWKVRHLKNNFRKARDWRNSHEARLLEADEGTNSVDARVLQICPAFHQLNNIFGEEKTQISWHEFVDTGESIETDFIKIDADGANEGEESDIVTNDSNIFDKSSASNFKDISWDKKRKHSTRKCFPNNSHQRTTEFPDRQNDASSLISYLADFQAKKTSLSKMKFEWERQKHIEEMELNKKRLSLEEEKMKAEIEFKKQELELRAREIERKDELEKTVAEIGFKKQELELKAREIERKDALEKEKTMAEIELKKNELELRAREIERDERLKVLEMEKDERIKKYEIEMKLKYQNKKI